ncbi:MAG: flagellin, partial [Myxococcota bacterium]
RTTLPVWVAAPGSVATTPVPSVSLPLVTMFRPSDAINAVSAATGVTAALNSAQELVLTASDGRNIVTSGNDTDGTGVVATDPGAATHTGSVVLTSSADIVVSGANPAAAGLTAGTSLVASASVATLDVSSPAAARTAIRRIDAAIAELNAAAAELGATSGQIDAAAESLAAQQSNLSSALGRTVDADVAAETARLSAQAFTLQAQVALLAQANVQEGWILNLFSGA